MEQTARTPETKIVAEKLKAALLLLQWKREMTVGGLKRKQRKSINEPPVNVCLTLTGFVFFRYEKVLWMDSWALWSPLGIKSWGWPIFGGEKNKNRLWPTNPVCWEMPHLQEILWMEILHPFDMWFIPLCTRFYWSQVLQDSFHQQYIHFHPGPCFTAMFTRGVV